MALRYEFAWDFGLYETAPAVTVDDDGAAFVVTFSSGTHTPSGIESIVSGYTSFTTALAAALNAGTTGAGEYEVIWNGPTGYEINYDSGNFSLTFSGTAGTNMRSLLGMTGNRSGDDQYLSQCRPYYLIIPAMPGRSMMSDEYEPEGISTDASADDGSNYQTSKSTSETYCDWVQMAETDQAPSSFSSVGTYVFERQATTAVPWSYQHAWRHARGGKQPFVVVDGSENAVHELRAEGTTFHPQRFASQDIQLWNVPFKTRLLGRL
jgi:hypothetical protein